MEAMAILLSMHRFVQFPFQVIFFWEEILPPLPLAF